MLLVPVVSSNLAAMGYDPSSGELQIQFRKTGAIYSYPATSPDVYAGLVAAPSKGDYFNTYIKYRPYQRIDAAGQSPVNPGFEAIEPTTDAALSTLQEIEQFEGLL